MLLVKGRQNHCVKINCISEDAMLTANFIREVRSGFKVDVGWRIWLYETNDTSRFTGSWGGSSVGALVRDGNPGINIGFDCPLFWRDVGINLR